MISASSSLVPESPFGGASGMKLLLVISELATAMQNSGQGDVPKVCVPTRPQNSSEGAPRHNPSQGVVRSISALWRSEGNTPKRIPASALTELHILLGDRVHVFQGEPAFRRLSILPPSACSLDIEARAESAIAEASVGADLVIRVSAQTLARTLAGACGFPVTSALSMANQILHERWRPPPTFAGRLKNERFWNCLMRIHVYFRMAGRAYSNNLYRHIGQKLVLSMLRGSRCQTETVKTWIESLFCIISGQARNELEERILSLPEEERATLWRSRRLINKDDSDPLENCRNAIGEMSAPVILQDQQEQAARHALRLWVEAAEVYVNTNLSELLERRKTTSMHRASATVFASRSDGGGGAELHLMVGLYRLSQGKKSRLADVFGNAAETLSIETILSLTEQNPAYREEIEAAGLWFVKELDKKGMSYPFICIYPERETKGRTFMLLTYAEQQGGYNAAHLVSGFLRSRTDTREVYAGFNTRGWLGRMDEDIRGMVDALILWLDSRVATNPLPHPYCLEIYRPFGPVLTEFDKEMISRTFSPRRVHAATDRGVNVLKKLAYQEFILENLNCELLFTEKKKEHHHTALSRFAVRPQDAPPVRTLGKLGEITSMLETHRRIILNAPTGSGKTVLMAYAFNSIIQFPTIAALLIFEKGMLDNGRRVNVYYSAEKRIDLFDEVGEPTTILCTAYFVRKLAHQYPTMVVVLDEADQKNEYNLINLLSSRQLGWWTVVTSATVDELRGEDCTPRVTLEGGTNFPVEELEMDYEEMLSEIKSDIPKALVIVHSEPLCEKIVRTVEAAGRKAFALTQQQRQSDFMEKLDDCQVIVSTNAIRTSVTLPIEWVFDCCQVYETVHFPVHGMDSLVLFRTSQSMETQAKGRVGRIAPGSYVRVSGAPGDPQPYTPKILGRCDTIAAQLGTQSLAEFARELNVPALILQAYHIALFQRQKGKVAEGAPAWVSMLRHFADCRVSDLIELVGFEEAGIGSRVRNLEADLEVVADYRAFKQTAPLDYFLAIKSLRTATQPRNWFKQEFLNIERWQERFGGDSPGDLFSPLNLRAIAFALWRAVSVYQDGQLVGVFRNFSVAKPQGWALEKGKSYVVLGLSLFQGETSCRGVLPLTADTTAWLQEIMSQRVKVHANAADQVSFETCHILGWDKKRRNEEVQKRETKLNFDSYGSHTVFTPNRCEEIVEHLVKAQLVTRVGESVMTTRGSPMSSTASFPVLNAFGTAAHMRARDITGEQLRGASVFGDDDAVAGSKAACDLVIETREALGLETKMSDTVMIPVKKDGKPVESRSLGVYTERLIAQPSLREVMSVKPSGLVRLFHAHHPSQVIASEVPEAADMLHFSEQIRAKAPRWHETLMLESEKLPLRHARRVAAPRRILASSFLKQLRPNDVVAEGDVDRLFLHLESALLTVYPSTMGKPARVEDPVIDVVGHPIIPLTLAREIADKLQADDCYFKLRGPPLKFTGRNYASGVAAWVGQARGLEFTNDPNSSFYALGWGGTSSDRPAGEIEGQFETLEHDLDYIDVLA